MGSKGKRIKWVCLVSTCKSEFMYWDGLRCNKKRKCPVCGSRDYMTFQGYETLRAGGNLDEYGNVRV